MRVIHEVLSSGIVGDVEKLGAEVVFVTDSVFVIAGVPDVTGFLVLGSERIAALDELNAARRADVRGGRDKDVDVIGHDGEAMKQKFGRVSIAKESGDEKLGVFCALEMPVAIECEDGDGVGVELLADRGHAKESIPQGLKPLLSNGGGRAKAEALAYLEAGPPRLKPWPT